MTMQISAVTLGVKDLECSKKFYGDGLGCPIDQDHPGFVSFNLGEGAASSACIHGTLSPPMPASPRTRPAVFAA